MRLHYREKLGIPKRSNLEPAASVAERDGRPTEREVDTSEAWVELGHRISRERQSVPGLIRNP